jgi:CHAT domain-containing protein
MAARFFGITSSRQHEFELHNPALSEELRIRDILDGVGVMTSGAFVAAYELSGLYSYYHTEEQRNRAKESLETVLRSMPDGKLHLVPFDALVDENGKYVLESHIVTYAPSATVLHLLRRSHSTDKLAMSFLGVGDVIYPRSAVVTANAGGRTTTKQNATADFFDLEGVTFPELPGSRQEVVSVAGVMTGDKRALLGKDATEAEFKALPLGDFRVIHLAVHGLGNSEFPDRAALVLGSSPTAGEDGLLQVREIRDLPLRADLVTLSACDTGSGKLLGEEGIASLERAFLLAGAKSVIASLWTADDTYTVALMKRLYQHLIDGFDEGAALQQAKLDLLKQFAGQAPPVYWAGFTLVGDGATALAK